MIDFNINSDDLNNQFGKIQGEVNKKIDLKKIYRGVGEVLQTAVNFQFEEEGAYLGRKWEPLAASTIERRKKLGKWPGSIMQVTGRLKSSFTYSIVGNSVIIGTNVSYAKRLHFGIGRMPARPLFSSMLNEETKDEIKHAILKGLG